MARQEFLERLADNHEIQIKKTLEDLEARIVSQISTVTEGADAVSTKIAIDLRTDLKQYIDETYRTTADTLVRDYDQIVNEFMEEFGGLDIPDKFKSLTKVDLLTINQLKFQQFAGFEDLANRYLNEISSQVYQNAIAGKPFNEMVKDLRGLITGEVDRRGRPMSTYASQIAHDSVMQFDGQFTVYKSKEAGLDKFKYTGTLVTDSRPHCVTHLNKVYTEEQIRSIWQGSWAGKSEGDPFTVRGGYRCRHTWLPVADEFFDAEEPQDTPIQVPTIPRQRGRANQLQGIGYTTLIAKLDDTLSKSATDKRYVINPITNEPARKFTGKIDDYGKAQIKKKETYTQRNPYTKKVIRKTDYEYTNEDFAVINQLFEEINDLAKKYDVQSIRGIKRVGGKSTVANMGDGVLGLNIKFNRINYHTKERVRKTSNWKFGDDKDKRPFTVDAYFDDPIDKIRTTFYHELGHHIHQQKFVKDFKDYRNPLIEKKLIRIFSKKRNGASLYSDKNAQEWFCENFALFHMDRKDLVDPEWIKFFKENVDVKGI
jgi:hypothetical protein